MVSHLILTTILLGCYLQLKDEKPGFVSLSKLAQGHKVTCRVWIQTMIYMVPKSTLTTTPIMLQSFQSNLSMSYFLHCLSSH